MDWRKYIFFPVIRKTIYILCVRFKRTLDIVLVFSHILYKSGRNLNIYARL